MAEQRVRIGTVQFQHRPLTSWDEFVERVRTDVLFAKDFGCQLVCFPEYLTGCLLTLPEAGERPGRGQGQRPLAGSAAHTPQDVHTGEALAAWHRWTDAYLELFSDLARQMSLWILGGTHLVRQGSSGEYANTAHLFEPSGRVYTQQKLHLTPCEQDPWRLACGQSLQLIETDWARLAILVCFDVEFPEAARAAADAGADLILCPSATDDRAGFWRVRYSCHARAVENQVYVVHSALVGGLPSVRYLEQSYGRSGILSPCDVPFPADGVVADGEWNQHLVVVGDVDLALLDRVRRAGSVTPRLCRRSEYPCEVVPAGRR